MPFRYLPFAQTAGSETETSQRERGEREKRERERRERGDRDEGSWGEAGEGGGGGSLTRPRALLIVHPRDGTEGVQDTLVVDAKDVHVERNEVVVVLLRVRHLDVAVALVPELRQDGLPDAVDAPVGVVPLLGALGGVGHRAPLLGLRHQDFPPLPAPLAGLPARENLASGVSGARLADDEGGVWEVAEELVEVLGEGREAGLGVSDDAGEENLGVSGLVLALEHEPRVGQEGGFCSEVRDQSHVDPKVRDVAPPEGLPLVEDVARKLWRRSGLLQGADEPKDDEDDEVGDEGQEDDKDERAHGQAAPPHQPLVRRHGARPPGLVVARREILGGASAGRPRRRLDLERRAQASAVASPREQPRLLVVLLVTVVGGRHRRRHAPLRGLARLSELDVAHLHTLSFPALSPPLLQPRRGAGGVSTATGAGCGGAGSFFRLPPLSAGRERKLLRR